MKCIVILAALCVCAVAGSETVSLSPTGAFITESVEGKTVWVSTHVNYRLFFDVPSSFAFSTSAPVYVEIEYLDEGFGTLLLTYDAVGSTNVSEIHTRSSRVNSGAFVKSYHVLQTPRLAGAFAGGTDLFIRPRSGVAPRISSVRISTEIFPDEQLNYVVSRPWLLPYEGTVRDFVDRTTLAGKVLTGYQGWFRAPNDPADNGWRHWGRNSESVLDATQMTVDMWPFLDDYRMEDLYRAGEVMCRDGRPAFLFSSADADIVRRHFRWMRAYDIDGVFVQRFVNRSSSGFYGANEFVLNNVRTAAAEEGRVWAIEYDIGSLETNIPLEVITNDWRYLVDELGILDDPRYLYEDGKPVLFIWGFSVSGREFSVEQANEVVDFFRTQNLYLIGGVPRRWTEMPEWHGHYQRYDSLQAWMERSLTELQKKASTLSGWGMDILPHAWPGFSWDNMKQLPSGDSLTARNGGAFYWTNLYNAVACGAKTIFLGMFDEYDEGTAIMPMSDNPPHPHTGWGTYLDNEGRDPFWYLRLSGAAKEMLNGFRALTPTLPAETDLTPPAYSGDSRTVYLSATNVTDGLVHLSGATSFCFRLAAPRPAVDRVTVEIEYADASALAGASIGLVYDGQHGAHTPHAKTHTAPGTGGWKNLRWNIADALFAGRQDGGADFTVTIPAGSAVDIRRVSVFLPEQIADTAKPRLTAVSGRMIWNAVADAVGWRLYTTPSLLPAVWAPVPAVTFSNDICFSNPSTNAVQFFQLRKNGMLE